MHTLASFWRKQSCHELWPGIVVSHLISFPNNSLSLAGGKHQRKITISHIQICSSNSCYSCLVSSSAVLSYNFSLLLSGWVVIAICCGSNSVQGIVSSKLDLLLIEQELLSSMTSHLNGCLHFGVCSYQFFLNKLWPADFMLSMCGKIIIPMFISYDHTTYLNLDVWKSLLKLLIFCKLLKATANWAMMNSDSVCLILY